MSCRMAGSDGFLRPLESWLCALISTFNHRLVFQASGITSSRKHHPPIRTDDFQHLHSPH